MVFDDGQMSTFQSLLIHFFELYFEFRFKDGKTCGKENSKPLRHRRLCAKGDRHRLPGVLYPSMSIKWLKLVHEANASR